MKHNDIMPECFIDTMLVGSLLNSKVNHKHSCNEVVKEMEKGKFKDAFAVGIIDNDKRKISYIDEFNEIGKTDNLTFLKHNKKHHYLIKVGKEHKAMETFIMANVKTIGMRMEDFGLPSDLDELTKVTKDSVSTQKDTRILSLCRAICRSQEVTKLKDILVYLASKKYDVELETIAGMINK